MKPLFLVLLLPLWAHAQYYPDKTWQRKAPAELGMDAAKLKEAVDFAVKSEVPSPRDLTLNHYQTFGREPHGGAQAFERTLRVAGQEHAVAGLVLEFRIVGHEVGGVAIVGHGLGIFVPGEMQQAQAGQRLGIARRDL